MRNIVKKILLIMLGMIQGFFGSFAAILGFAAAFPGTSLGAKDYEEDMLFVPLGYLIMILWVVVMATAFIRLRKSKSNLLMFTISWIVGVVGIGVVFYLWN